MEDNTRFVPTYAGAPHFRLPFRSVFMPIVPCVLDGCLSLLELITKLEYIINQYHDAIEANHTDIMNLYNYVEGALDDLREYIDTQDAATLASAKAYTDSAISTLTAYIDAQDAATLAAAQAYADTQLTAAKAYTDAQVGALRTYTDAQLALKQDLLTFDLFPTDDSTNPVTSTGIKGAIDAVWNRVPWGFPATFDFVNGTFTTVGITFADLYRRLHTYSQPVYASVQVTNTGDQRNTTTYFYVRDYGSSQIIFDAFDVLPGNLLYYYRVSLSSADVWTATSRQL